MMKLALALAVLVCGFLSFEIHSLRNENQRLQAKLESLSDSMALGSIRPEPDGDTTSKKTAQNPSLEKILEYRRRLAEKRGKLSEIIKKIEALKGKAKPVPTADPAELDRRIREKKELLAGMRKRLRVVRENLKPQGSSHEYIEVKGRLQEIEKQIHDTKVELKNLTASNAPESQKTALKTRLSDLHDQLKAAQLRQTNWISKTTEQTGELPESTLKRKASALSREIRKMETARDTPVSATHSPPELEGLEKEAGIFTEEIHSLKKSSPRSRHCPRKTEQIPDQWLQPA